MIEDTFQTILKTAIPPFWQTWDFWIFLILAVVGVIFSILAFREAARAKNAAAAAGRSVKIQTVTIELTEILQRLDKLDSEITFPEARDLLSEVSRRLRRLIAPFSTIDEIVPLFESLKEELKQSKEALDAVKPSTNELSQEAPNAVYYALQGHFGSVSDFVAEISGILESKTLTTN